MISIEENNETAGTEISAAQRVMGKLKENQSSLHMARVPQKTLEDFKSLADKDFCGDYGMLLKWLMDGIIGQDVQALMPILNDHETRLAAIEGAFQVAESKLDGKDGKKIKMLNGKVVEVPQK